MQIKINTGRGGGQMRRTKCVCVCENSETGGGVCAFVREMGVYASV